MPKLLLVIVLSYPGILAAGNWTPEQEAVIATIAKCWNSDNYETSAACFHPEYLGWYKDGSQPMDYEKKMAQVESWNYDEEETDFEVVSLDHHSVVIDGDLAVAVYTVTYQENDPETGKFNERLEHWTEVYRMNNGMWQSASEHVSTPTDRPF